jgi:allantoate deiminase
MTDASLVLRRCAELDRFSASSTGLERVYLSREHALANERVADWMRAAGLRTWQDAAGNQCGRREGREPGLPALLLGSHLDTVPDAGSYDGMLGVVMAIAVCERLAERTDGLPFALEVIGFGDEEGTRFGTALMASRAVAGTWEDDWWDLRDRGGTTLHKAFLDFGLDPRRIRDAARWPDELVGYLEAHIEQGPFLEAEDQSVGYVTSIAGARRFRLSVIGEARHAGGTPYERRRDALTAASEAIVAIERLARPSGCLATVGRIESTPGAVNVIPGRADFSLDLRAATDAARDAMWDAIAQEISEVCQRRHVRFQHRETHRAPAVSCAGWLQQAVVDGIAAGGDTRPLGLWSPAGHDAMALGAATDVAMLFVRCFDGISHHPAEHVREVDVAVGLDAYEAAVLAVAEAVEQRTLLDGAPSGA